MKHSELIRRSDIWASGALLTASVVLLFSIGRIAGSPVLAQAVVQAQAVTIAAGQCQTILPKLGATFSAKDSAIEIREPSARDLASLVERSSLMLQSCPGFEIKDFCAGEGCLPERGLMLTLQMKGV